MKISDIRLITGEKDKTVVITIRDDDMTHRQVTQPLTPETDRLVHDFVAGTIGDEELMTQLTRNANVVRHTEQMVEARLAPHSKHLSCDGNHVWYDDRRIDDGALEKHLVKVLASDDEADMLAWCRFTERLYANVDDRIRKELFQWLEAQGSFTLDKQGRIIGYRGCALVNGVPHSQNQGTATVDGCVVTGAIPNRPGSIVEMDRDKIEADSSVACGPGLHVGTLGYARDFASFAICDRQTIVRVAVAPEDVVSVPTDHNAAKMRVSRFEVLDHEPVDSRGRALSWDELLTYHPELVTDEDDEGGDVL